MLPFKSNDRMSLGVEMELQLLDRERWDLYAKAPDLFHQLGGQRSDIKAEIFQSMVEVATPVCNNIADVRSTLRASLDTLRCTAEALGVALVSAGSHPTARHRDRVIYPADRFEELIERNQWIARRLMIFGLHVHVGMRDGDHAAAMTNGLLPYLPHLLALSASSPFWEGENTHLASSRITIFEALPTAGHPCTFTSWNEFERIYDAMHAAGAVSSIKDLWWDVRPHPDFGTVEVRVCDSLPTLNETVAMVALIQALFRRIDQEHLAGRKFTPPPTWIMRENKWRASRRGLEAEIVLDEAGHTAPLRGEIETLLEDLEPVAHLLDSTAELKRVESMLAAPSYARQRAWLQRERSLQAVTRNLVREFATNTPIA